MVTSFAVISSSQAESIWSSDTQHVRHDSSKPGDAKVAVVDIQVTGRAIGTIDSVAGGDYSNCIGARVLGHRALFCRSWRSDNKLLPRQVL